MEKYLIVGAGRSGIDAAKLLLQLGKDFVLFDGNTSLDTAAVCERIGKRLDSVVPVKRCLAGHDIEI